MTLRSFSSSVVVTLVFSGCTSTQGTKVEQSKFERVTKNETSQEVVVQILGTPDIEANVANEGANFSDACGSKGEPLKMLSYTEITSSGFMSISISSKTFSVLISKKTGKSCHGLTSSMKI